MLGPEKWVKGMAIIDPSGCWRPHLLKYRADSGDAWAVEFTDDLAVRTETNPFSWYREEAPSLRPATFSDLSRDPADEPVGREAVCVLSKSDHTDDRVGRVYVKARPDRDMWKGEDGDWWQSPPPDWFAPLAAEEGEEPKRPDEPEEPHEYRCSVCGHEWSDGSALCPHGPHDEPPEEQAEEGKGSVVCERVDGGIGVWCSTRWFRSIEKGDKPTVDPCQPCALAIDRDAAVTAREKSRCVHGWPLGGDCPWCHGRIR